MNDTDASRYDRMINWDTRLKREIPVIAEFFKNGNILDVACSSGRHSLALEKYGFSCVGIDISEDFIELANKLRGGDSGCHFVCKSATAIDLIDSIRELSIDYFDNALMLGNAIANMGGKDAGIALMKNIFLLLIPGGRLFLQTVNRPEKPIYLPLRELEGGILQRIQVPVDGKYNVELHVNLIRDGEYVRKNIAADFSMYTFDEFYELLTSTGFKIDGVYGGYNNEVVSKEGGETVIWNVYKPEIEITKESLALFSLSKDDLKRKVMAMWQELYLIMQYNFVREYRFIHPRILSHPNYSKIILKDKKILDIGCALGTDLEQMVMDGADPTKMYGLDISREVIMLRNKLFEDRGIKFIVGDISENDFKDTGGAMVLFDIEFDVIYAGSLLHLLGEDEIIAVLRKIYSMLSSGGIFFGRTVVVTDDYNGDYGYYKYLPTIAGFNRLLAETGFGPVDMTINDDSYHACERSYGDVKTVSFTVSKGK